jgi:hypothetical protein
VIDSVNPHDSHVGARILDFLDAKTPWNRKLWNIGLSLTLLEITEAEGALRAGVLSDASLGFLLSNAQRDLGPDPGAGVVERRQVLQASLKQRPPDNLDFHVIHQHQQLIDSLYLQRWAAALRIAQRPKPERTARAITSYLLDRGFSSDFLHKWWKYKLKHEAGNRALADIVDEAHTLAQRAARDFEIVVPIQSSLTNLGVQLPPIWLPAPETSQWLQRNGFDVADVRQDGSFLFTVSSLDADAAVIQLSERLDQLTARLAVATKRSLSLLGKVWIRDEPKPFTLDRTRRGVWVEALHRENQLFGTTPSGSIDAAIDLLSHLQTSSPAAAVAGGWAAIEALLSESDDRVTAADRLAMLVACSFPRAELTALSYTLARKQQSFEQLLQGVNENSSRCDIVANRLDQVVANPERLSSSDVAAAARMAAMMSQPRKVLDDVMSHATVALRRLYRQRNLVLHWGRTNAVALRATLRTCAPLVGAGFDRVIHAHYVDRLSPLQLVARATTALMTVGTSDGPTCTRLLD